MIKIVFGYMTEICEVYTERTCKKEDKHIIIKEVFDEFKYRKPRIVRIENVKFRK